MLVVLTVREMLDGHRGFRTAAEIVELMKGRPKDLPPLIIVVERGDERIAYKVMAAIFNGSHVEMIDDNCDVVIASDSDRFRLWQDPKPQKTEPYFYEAHGVKDGRIEAVNDEDALRQLREKFGKHLNGVMVVYVVEENKTRQVWVE